jgi:hypothetical protein
VEDVQCNIEMILYANSRDVTERDAKANKVSKVLDDKLDGEKIWRR